MKQNFKIITAVLCLISCFVLAACSGNDLSDSKGTDNSQSQSDTPSSSPNTTQEPIEVTVGTMLDKPEKIVELEEFYISVIYPDSENESGVKTMEIALKDKGNPGILYISDGVLKLHENVYELSGNGDVVKYTKDVFAEKFTQDKESSAETLEGEVESLQNLLQLVGYGFVEASSDIKYKKCEDVKITLTGEAYKYELYAEDEVIGTICVDKQTGIFVKMTDSDGSDIMTVTSIKTTGFDIPEYK